MENILLCLVVINLVILALFLYRIEKLLENLRHELQQGSGDINEQIKWLWRVIKYFDLKSKEENKKII